VANGPHTLTIFLVDAAENRLAGAQAQATFIVRPENRAPTIQSGPTVTPEAPHVNENAEFAITAMDPDGDPLDVQWHFDDAVTLTGPATSRTFESPGHRTVTVTAADPSGLSASATLPFDVVVSARAGGTINTLIDEPGELACPPTAGAYQIYTRFGDMVRALGQSECWNGDDAEGRQVASGFYPWLGDDGTRGRFVVAR
jgi:hypothetical protein